MAAQATPINVTGTGPVVAGPATLRGFWLLVAATACTVTLYDDPAAAQGTILAQWITTAVNQDKVGDFADGIRCAKGIYLSVSTGAVTGSVRTG